MSCTYKWNDYCIECMKFVETIAGLNKNNHGNLEYIVDRANKVVALKKQEDAPQKSAEAVVNSI
jgi:hypothetical protein